MDTARVEGTMRVIMRPFGVAVATVVLVAFTAGSAVAQDAGTGVIQIVQGGIGQGTVTSDPAGIDCTLGFGDPIGVCAATFAAGAKVKLRAVAADSSKFRGWAPVNSCPKPKGLTVVAGQTHSCQPVFEFIESPTFLLQVPIEGSGTVTSDPAGISCTRDEAGVITGICAENFINGGTVTLTAAAAEGWIFQGFSGEDPDCADGIVVMDELTRCVATFVKAT